MPGNNDGPGTAADTMRPPPMAMHPAFARQHSHYSTHSSAEENPFFTPQERNERYEMEGEGAGALHKELHADEPAHGASSPLQRVSRPPTPLNPFATLLSGGQSSSSQRQHEEEQQRNPFASPEDVEDEDRDLVSPIAPSRSPERRQSPMIHYPSWGEVSEFDFAGDGRVRRSVRGQSSSESGGDGWRPNRDSAYGRHELA